MEIKEKLRELPSCPGVYLMKDALDSVIYVGKSKNLKSRVGSYFQSSKAHPPKVVKLVKHLKDFDYITTDTEFEAFMLECKLIREIKPIYNKLLKSPKSYSYMNINMVEKYPSIEITGEPCKNDGSLCFGPYTGRNTVERALQGIKECCRILCTSGSPKASACLNHSLGLCIGICLDDAAREQYRTIIGSVVKLLNGSDKGILEEMEAKMDSAASKLDFETAARFRDYIGAVRSLIGKAKVVEYTKENKNIVVLERLDDNSLKFFLIKGNKVLYSEKYAAGSNSIEKMKQILKTNILAYFSAGSAAASIEVGSEDIDESQIIYSYLNSKSSSSRHLIIPGTWLNASRGDKLDKALSKLLLPENA